MLLRARDVPVIEGPGIRLRVLAGALEGKTSPLRTPEPILIVDGWLDAGARTVLPLPSGWNLWLYARLGNLTAHNLAAPERGSGATLSSGEAVAVSADQAGSRGAAPGDRRGEICRDCGAGHQRADRPDRTVCDEQPGRSRTGHGGFQGWRVRYRDALYVSGQAHSSPSLLSGAGEVRLGSNCDFRRSSHSRSGSTVADEPTETIRVPNADSRA